MKLRRTGPGARKTPAGRKTLAGTVAVLALAFGAAATSPAHAAGTSSGEAPGPAAEQAAGPCNYSTATPTLRRGDTGPAVKQAQCYLLHTLIIDDIIEVSGTFDPKTELRVSQFQQRCADLPSTGVVNGATWDAMERFIGSGRTC
jgi:hypothetical protein